MRFRSTWEFSLVTLVFSNYAFAYTWPNPQLDELESQRYDRLGHNARDLASGVDPCDLFLFNETGKDTSGRLDAADWIRTAYHDMATHDISDGSGGLDASIRLELDRAENIGEGFEDTILLLTDEANRYVSVADVLALALVTAVEQCGGPKINYRGGRVDATVANNPGVPQPQEDFNTHLASFARQGFNQTEMIGLIACGHSFGGVQHASFPGIVSSGAAFFDSTHDHFDNKIATEYLAGTTANPLVVGPDATNSDKRIFSSDRNQTMSSFADPSVFASTCANLFARMIDTVPKGVQLTDVIEPLIVKPQDAQLTYMGDGTLLLTGEVRFWDMQEDPTRKVKLLWADRSGLGCTQCSSQLGHTPDQNSTFLTGDTHITSLWYSFSNTGNQGITINAKSSISKFWFQIDEGSNRLIENQGGVGFVIQDVVMLAVSSCKTTTGLKIDIAVRRSTFSTSVFLEVDDFNSGLPIVRTINVPGPSTNSLLNDYNIWTIQTDSPPQGWNIAAVVNGKKYATSNLDNRGFAACS